MYKRKRSSGSAYSRANKRARTSGGSAYSSRRRSTARAGGNYSQLLPRGPGGLIVSQGPEKKSIDFKTDVLYKFGAAQTQIDVAIGGVAAAPQLLNGCAPGSDIGGRLGRKITMKSVQWRITAQAAPTTTSGSLRTIIFLDMQANGVTPLIGDLLEDGSAAQAISSPLALANRERFRIISDKVHVLGSPVASATAVPLVVNQKGYKKLNQEVIFNSGTAGTVADIQTGALHCFTMTTCGVASPVVSSFFRVRFTDA